MAHETATLFFALLASALAATLVVLVGSLLVDRSDRLGLMAVVAPVSVELAAVVASACVLGSLYLSEVAGFVPCRLCWIQRGFMYPAALLLVAALVLRREWMIAGAGLLALVGLPVAVFHRIEQASGEIGGLCDASNPCSLKWVEHFGFVTIPTMAAVGFAGVATFTVLYFLRSSRRFL